MDLMKADVPLPRHLSTCAPRHPSSSTCPIFGVDDVCRRTFEDHMHASVAASGHLLMDTLQILKTTGYKLNEALDA